MKQGETDDNCNQTTQTVNNVVSEGDSFRDDPSTLPVADKTNLGNLTPKLYDEITESLRDWRPNPRFVANKERVDSVVDPVLPESDSVDLPQDLEANATNQKPQMPQMANATNATTQVVEFAKPTEWGKLWRIEKNGKYYVYRLRFHPRRITRPGGKITTQIEAKCHNRKGKGRHKESREDATRLRSRAFDIADRIQRIS